MRKSLNSLSYLFIMLFLSGCAANYYPLKNEHYYLAGGKELKVIVLPFEAHLGFNYNGINTLEQAKEKQKIVRESVIRALKEILPQKGYRIIDYLPIDAYEQEDYPDKDLLKFITELYNEYRSAAYSIERNVKDEKGQGFDYSVGLRVLELNGRFKEKPDAYLIISPEGFIWNLACADDTTMNTVAAVLSLGMNKLFPCPDDVSGIHMALVNAQDGNIMWLNENVFPGQSYLVYNQVKAFLTKTLMDLPSSL